MAGVTIMATINVTNGYIPRGPQREIHQQIETHRFNVLVTHRQMGKTVCAVNHIIKKALQNKKPEGRYFYVAPFLKQAKLIAWDYFKKYLAPFRNINGQNYLKVNEQELSVSVAGKFTIFVCGADNPDALRGTYADGVVLDEYGDMKPNVYDEIIRPMLLSREGWVLFCGTPKGQNQFYDVYNLANQKSGEEWWCGMYRATDTGIIKPEELKEIEETSPSNIFRQEYLCDFTASATDVLITIDAVNKALGRKFMDHELNGAPRVIGVDVARFGDDKSVIFARCGLQAYVPLVFEKLDNVELAGRVAQEIDRFKPDAVFIDAGNGSGVIDTLKRNGYKVTEVPFGGKPLKEGKYANKRAEMWGEMSEWIKQGAIQKADGLESDLTCATYDFDTAGKMRLEPKEAIKKRLGKSPDLADALALTFAMPVHGKAYIRSDGRQKFFDDVMIDW